ncbi:MAG: transthyretin-like family protein [Planctomycetia bacterium]|nr:transthyretin-like family protein [Planctomycetia bacterium]
MSVRLLALRIVTGACLFVGALCLSGCGSSVKLVPAEGVLKIGGKPAANISVQFMPDVLKGGKGPTSFATTDVEGKFRLKTQDGKDGAVAGAHTVILADLDEERPPQGQVAKKLPRLDSKYTTASGGLSAEVKEGGGPILLEVPGR